MNKNIKRLLKMFLTFFKIGLFTFGGGLAMIPIMEKEFVDKQGWVDKEKFVNAVSITQTVPGAVAINMSIFFGYNIAGFAGALVAALGIALPSFLVILTIALVFRNFNDYLIVQNILKGIRPAVVALIIYAGLDLAKYIDWDLPLALTTTLVLIIALSFAVNPAFLILMAIIFGSISYKKEYFIKLKNKLEKNYKKVYKEVYND
ncbi:chromate transporter [Halanaerobium sp. Z-7514]|uniref:Chromate transporter n=1 Tax=Halanaerobium polyolivorans TaxID=2886943 RepID=A0AAW4WYV3_9FIRM|nr:chromate transporter [Halanaerobium polyolivorans]MCC3143919.1 chromate transporter [Halanaerobium polyolivorans]RQD79562.1 MAG: chromate transporter [Halanaerobium sp. MSAO_Bac5]